MSEKFIIVKDVVKKIRKFGITGRTIDFKIKPQGNFDGDFSHPKEAVEQIVTEAIKGVKPDDYLGFTFCNKDFSRGEGWLKFQKASDVTFRDIWKVISNLYQSNSLALESDNFCLSVTSIRMPTGKGMGPRKFNSFTEECAKRKGIITIKNTDNLCLPQALVVAKTRFDKCPDYDKIRLNTKNIQTSMSLELIQKAGVVLPEEGCGIPELKKFQEFLKGYKITVYNYSSKGRDVIFEGDTDASKCLNLLYCDGHYNVITSLTAAFVCNNYCEKCHVPYDHKNAHRCQSKCPACQQSPACITTTKIKCEECRRQFRSKECFENHRKPGSLEKSIVCKEITQCDECFKTIKSSRKHFCGEVFCKICNKHQPSEHLCYMQIDNGKPKTKDFLFVIYDLETRQEKALEKNGVLHEPNLCVFKQYCHECLETDVQVCKQCGVRLQILKCDDPVTPFTHHLLTIRKKFKDVIAIAHNGGRFDHQFILNYILTQTNLTPEIITRGSGLISMIVGNVKFLDSINYFPMALSALPKAFGLTELKKGYFPHLLNRTEFANYKGLLPPIEYYDPDHMKPDARIEFLKWYEEHKNDEFDMKKEIIGYCVSDVEILAQSCLKFRKLIMQEGNVCPFTEACTLPSACNKVFRRNFLKKDTIGIIPKKGYRWRDIQSKIAVQWLIWEEHKNNIDIIHAAKSKEAIVAGVKVDGFCKDTNQVFEFHGCFYHGCPRCIQYNRKEPVHDDPVDTMENRLISTNMKVERLRSKGYDVIEKWECDFRKELEGDCNIKKYVNTHPLITNLPLDPRDSFYGGRTGATKSHYKIKENEKIKYVDVCSLYPWVNKFGKYPVGHPEVYVGDVKCRQLNLNFTEGIIKCKILPPQDLYHPVLPMKCNGRLMFSLCRSCCEGLKKKCDHNIEERAITGTWVIDEVRKAIEKGYNVLHIYEIWKYETIRYNKDTEGLFTGFINKFLRIKQQASGWPLHCSNQEAKNQYIQEYLEKEGVKLNPDEIDFNPGLRLLGKSLITSFWGKLGQRENQPKCTIVNKSVEFFKILSDPAIQVNNITLVNDSTVIVNWEYKEECFNVLPTVNVVLAAYTTAQARLKLYDYLDKLDDRVVYYDTDCTIYVSQPGKYEVPVGSFLGDMTDELEVYGKGSYIKEFVSGGPKNYAYKVYSPQNNTYHSVCKVKGITINYKASKDVNFEKMKDMVLQDEPPKYICTKQIRRTKTHEVVTVNSQKIFQLNFRKRKLLDNYDSVPWGYKKRKVIVNNID